MSSIGERLRIARKEKGLTQVELAKRMKISSVGISQWESGTRNPKKETIMRLATVLDVPFSYFGTDAFDDDEALNFLLRSWEHADYQATMMHHNGGSPAEIERWEHVCDELRTIYDEIVIKNQTKQDVLPDRTTEIVEIFKRLNFKGQQRIIEIAGDYVQIPDYQQKEMD